jgi:hypothetical protein
MAGSPPSAVSMSPFTRGSCSPSSALTEQATLANAIRRIKTSARVVDPELAAEAWIEADPLTDRERQVLRYAGEGRRWRGNRQLA